MAGREIGTPGKQGRAPVPSRRQFNIALDRCDGYPHAKRNKALLATLFGLGLRPKEASSLMLGDIYDFKLNAMLTELTLMRSYTKFGKIRQLPLNNEFLIGHLMNYINERREEKNQFRADRPLFLSQRGGAFSSNSIGNLANELLEKRAGIPRASTYSGRRYFATTLVNKRADVRKIQLLMGHSSLATTQIYIESDSYQLAEVTKDIL